MKNGEKSRYKSWFYDLAFPVMRPDDPDKIPGYTCFAYERKMPKLNTSNREVQLYFADVGTYWIKKYHVDGWRLDVAADLGHSNEYNHQFWRDFRRNVKEANPNAVILAEHYGVARDWLEGDQWDTVMNYDAFMAVSYTHLDVYKRQVRTLPHFLIHPELHIQTSTKLHDRHEYHTEK